MPLPPSELQGVKLPEVPQIVREADMDMDIIQKLLDADQDIDDDLNENEAIANNNDDLCLSLESSPDKAQHCTLPDPIDDIIPQFDGGADEKDDSSPRKDFSIMGLLSPPGQQDQQQPLQLQPQVAQQPQQPSQRQLLQAQQPPRRPSDDDIVFISSTGPTSVKSATSRPPPSQSRSSMQPQTPSRTPMPQTPSRSIMQPQQPLTPGRSIMQPQQTL